MQHEHLHPWRKSQSHEAIPLPASLLRLVHLPRSADGLPLADLESWQCRWPIGIDDECTRFCGERAAGNRPYCQAHAAIAYRPADARSASVAGQ